MQQCIAVILRVLVSPGVTFNAQGFREPQADNIAISPTNRKLLFPDNAPNSECRLPRSAGRCPPNSVILALSQSIIASWNFRQLHAEGYSSDERR
jgi:hypothetical protein